jgi:hypothetical protein
LAKTNPDKKTNNGTANDAKKLILLLKIPISPFILVFPEAGGNILINVCIAKTAMIAAALK